MSPANAGKQYKYLSVPNELNIIVYRLSADAACIPARVDRVSLQRRVICVKLRLATPTATFLHCL